MTEAQLEHVNVTCADPDHTAKMLVELFGWHIRWSGAAKNGGYTVHVGTDAHYIALYRPLGDLVVGVDTYHSLSSVNHIGVVVPDLEQADQNITAAGYTTYSHQDYEPGRRFYFRDHDNIEYEVVSYR